MTGTRGLKSGDLVTVPAGRRVVESVSPDGLSFTDTAGARHLAAAAELVPFAEG